jgi:tetraacyldisaccharide 4'-kinase
MKTLLLLPATALFFVGQRLWEFSWLLRKPVRVPSRVISIGNIAMGGAGKTPLVAFVAGKFQEAGKRVAIVAGGYKRKSTKPITVSSKNKPSWIEVGDEPAMLSQMLPDIEIYVDRDKTSAAVRAANDGHEVIIVDDGFQHRKLHRDLDIVCLNSERPFGLLLPAGPFREPKSALRRADCMVWFDFKEETKTEGHLMPAFRARKRVSYVRNADSSQIELTNKKVLAFCGIGNPESFHKSLKETGCAVAAFLEFRDHHLYDRFDMERIAKRAREQDAQLIVTTMKDFVRVEDIWSGNIPLSCLEIAIELENEGEFLKLIGL